VIVAIDGPAGSGKSTTARRVAEQMGWLYLDTGAMYRAVAVAFLEAGVPFTDEAAAELLADLRLDLVPGAGGFRVLLNGEDVTDRIRTPESSVAASRVSALPAVRERLVAEQRRIAGERRAAGEGAVLEGRDIGTVVFPDAEVKVFLVADPGERARRRRAELSARGEAPSLAEVAADIVARDERDRTRAIAPLRPASDAVELDTTALSVEEQVQSVVELVRAAQAVP
jgi:CMP/dCMP kinase